MFDLVIMNKKNYGIKYNKYFFFFKLHFKVERLKYLTLIGVPFSCVRNFKFKKIKTIYKIYQYNQMNFDTFGIKFTYI